MSKSDERRKKRIAEGLCPQCGDWAYPYHYCTKHRIYQNLYRVLRGFEKKGWVDVDRDPSDGKKIFKWKHGIDVGRLRNYSPETIAKMQLPRMKGKPITDQLIQDSIIKVLEENGCPMTEEEIHKGFKQLKTIGKVIPETDNLIREYKLIKEKKSNLSKNRRDAVQYKINFLLKRMVITENQLI